MADDKLKTALELFELVENAESDNRIAALDDLKFARLGEQWPEEMKRKRMLENRPCLTINKMPSFIRQVVNDGRLNKPAIKVHPADDSADVKTAEIINGIIRNIEVTSNADVAYDTGLEYSVTMGFGYWRVSADYAHDDTFYQDLKIDRIANPFSVYGDPFSKGADSSDWNDAFITDLIPKKIYEKKYKGADKVDWSIGAYADMPVSWKDGENVLVAEWWSRDEVKEKILRLSNNLVIKESLYLKKIDGLSQKDILDAQGITVIGDRETRSYKVKQRIMTGAEVLEENEWPGMYIPIVAVYGEDINVEGKRYLRSLIRDAKDPQTMFNYWRTCSTELVALAPKTPFIGPVGAFETDVDKWQSANTDTHAFIEYDLVDGNPIAPQRQSFAGPPAGALQEALNASDDMKSVMGIYDASLGARSNETSGRAIVARQKEGDVSTFHFIDNQARAIRHTGKILIDLIPHYYNDARIVRIMGPDKKPQNVAINQPITGPDGQPMRDENGIEQIYDLTVGKYDLTVETGPSFSTKREEAAYQMTEFIRAFPAAAPLIGDLLAKNQDWPDADEVGRRLQAALPPQVQGQNPQLQGMQQQMQQMDAQAKQAIAELQKKLADAEMKAKSEENSDLLEVAKIKIDSYKAETERLKMMAPALGPQEIQALIMQTLQQVLQTPDITPQDQPPMQPPPMQPQQNPPSAGFFTPEQPQGMHQMPDGSMMPDAMMPQMPQQPEQPLQ